MYGGRAEEIKRKQMMEAKKKAANNMLEEKKKELKEIYEDFQKTLITFAKNNPKEIRKNSEFRNKFNHLCLELGVDPLVSRKNVLSELGFGDFYSELAIKLYRILISKRNINGGLMKISELIQIHSKQTEDKINKDDVKKALETLSLLGTSCYITGDYVCSVPSILSNDSMELIKHAEQTGYVSQKILTEKAGWSEVRFKTAINQLIKEGLVWVDEQVGAGQIHYYFPTLW